ncbi:glutaredoxin family protein [Virgibacillus kimchii]
MIDKEVVVYISDDSKKCDQLLAELDQLDVNYKTKNVTKNKSYMRDLQNEGVYGTPATFIGNEKNPILGFQKSTIIKALKDGEQDWNQYF